MISPEKSKADAPTVLACSVFCARHDQGALDDQLLRVTEWANRTLRGDGGGGGGCGDDYDGGDFAVAYDRVYLVTLHGDRTADEQLYQRLRACVAHHLNDAVVPALERASGGVELMAVARRAYTDYSLAADRLADACTYLDEMMRRRGRAVEPVRAMTRSLFRDMLLQRRCDEPFDDDRGAGARWSDRPAHVDLLARLEDAVVRSADVHLWAGHECADAVFCGRTLLAAVADSASASGLGDALARRLRGRFLDEADRRLRTFVRSMATPVDGYAEAAAHVIDAEAAIALRYGGPAAARAVADRAAMLLVAERHAFVVHSDTGLCRMLETGRDVDAVAKVYALLARLPDAFGSQVVAKAVACCADRRLHGRMAAGVHRHHDHNGVDGHRPDDVGQDDGDDEGTTRVPDHTRFVNRVMRFRDAMDGYLRYAFGDDAVVVRAVERNVRQAFDCCDDAVHHVARHLSDLLAAPEAPSEETLDRMFDLLGYLDDEALETFELDYRYHLTLRLAMNQGWQTREDREEKAYHLYVTHCGRQRSRRLRLLLDDVRASRELGRRGEGLGDRPFAVTAAAAAATGRWPTDVDVVAINRHVWPLPAARPSTFVYPRAARAAFRRYRELYAAAHDGRRVLTFIPQLCTAQVEATRRDGRRVRFTATMYQAAVLLLFNGRARAASRVYMRRKTEIPEPELRHTLESLLHDRVLRTGDGGDVYRLHRDYRDADDDSRTDLGPDEDDSDAIDDEAAAADGVAEHERTVGWRYRLNVLRRTGINEIAARRAADVPGRRSGDVA